MSARDDKGDASGEERLPPIGETCRAAVIGNVLEFSECLSQSPGGCPHRAAFGNIYLCWHPRHNEIVQITTAEKKALGGR